MECPKTALNNGKIYMQDNLPSSTFMFIGTAKPVSSLFFVLNSHVVTQFVVLASIGTAILVASTLVAL
jgi:hypothetical protein